MSFTAQLCTISQPNLHRHQIYYGGLKTIKLSYVMIYHLILPHLNQAIDLPPPDAPPLALLQPVPTNGDAGESIPGLASRNQRTSAIVPPVCSPAAAGDGGWRRGSGMGSVRPAVRITFDGGRRGGGDTGIGKELAVEASICGCACRNQRPRGALGRGRREHGGVTGSELGALDFRYVPPPLARPPRENHRNRSSVLLRPACSLEAPSHRRPVVRHRRSSTRPTAPACSTIRRADVTQAPSSSSTPMRLQP
jgi:hypothetical protein